MAWEISIGPDGWGDIYLALQKKSQKWLARAVASDDAQHEYFDNQGMTEKQYEAYEAKVMDEYAQFSHDSLVDLAFACIEKNNTCDNGGWNYWVDMEGDFKVKLPESRMP